MFTSCYRMVLSVCGCLHFLDCWDSDMNFLSLYIWSFILLSFLHLILFAFNVVGSCLDCAWNFLSHKVRTRLLPHCWSMPDSQHCKHCWLHQMSQRWERRLFSFWVSIICLNLSLVLFIRLAIVCIHVFPMVGNRRGPLKLDISVGVGWIWPSLQGLCWGCDTRFWLIMSIP